jgi:hypothetical protein
VATQTSRASDITLMLSNDRWCGPESWEIEKEWCVPIVCEVSVGVWQQPGQWGAHMQKGRHEMVRNGSISLQRSSDRFARVRE